MAWYDIHTEQKAESKAEYVARVKYEKIVTRAAQSFMEIVGNDLTESVQYRIVTNNSFNAISVYEYLSKTEQITELYIAVYRMNLRAVTYLRDVIEKKKIKAVIILSSFFRENKKYEKWARDMVNFADGSDLVIVGFSRNHAKVFCAKTASGKHIVFEGSGNLSDNARIEQYIIENNEKVYNFHKGWILNSLTDEKD